MYLISWTTFSKLFEICFDRWRSPAIAFCFSLLETLDDQCIGSLGGFHYASVVILPLLLIMFVSINLEGFTSIIKFTFGWSLFNFWKAIVFLSFCFFFHLLIMPSKKRRFFKNWIISFHTEVTQLIYEHWD